MIALSDLWLPILASAVFVFVASSILHMVIPIHKGDYKKLPGEDKLLEAMRGERLEPGTYMFPCPESMKAMGSPEMLAKYGQGPVGFMTVISNGPPAMGKNLTQWFIYTLVIGVFVAYLGALALGRGVEYGVVFRFTGTAAILGYALAAVPESIWKGQRWGVTLTFIFDGLVYGLVTGATFAGLWPAAA